MKKLCLTIIITILASIGTIYYYLNYGDPQSSKYIFMWQNYDYFSNTTEDLEDLNIQGYMVYTPEFQKIYEPPAGYTGIRKCWDRNGNLMDVYEYFAGKRDTYNSCIVNHRGTDTTYYEQHIVGFSFYRIYYDENGVLTSIDWEDLRISDAVRNRMLGQPVYDSRRGIDRRDDFKEGLQKFNEVSAAFRKRAGV